jgi:hypothetical protein
VDTLALRLKNQEKGLLTQVQEGCSAVPLLTEYYRSIISQIKVCENKINRDKKPTHVFWG